MGKYSTYGMAGIGIAAAIGFVFALAILNSNAGTGSPEVAQRLVETQPDAASSFFFTQQAPPADGGALAGESSAMLKQDESADSSLQQEMFMTQDATELRPALSSVIAVNGTTGDVIAEVAEGSLFVVGKPVFIQAQFVNQNEASVLDHTLVMTLTRNGADDAMLEQAANLRGDIGANEGVSLEFHWNPDAEGEYLLQVFSLTPGDLVQGALEPALSITIRASV